VVIHGRQAVRRVNVDLTQGMLRELDERAARFNVSRQAVIKTLLRQALDQNSAARPGRVGRPKSSLELWRLAPLIASKECVAPHPISLLALAVRVSSQGAHFKSDDEIHG